MPTLKKGSKSPPPTVGPFPELGPGWSLRTVTRGDGKRQDKYWISPGGERTFRSRREVDRYLAATGNEDESEDVDKEAAAAAAPGPKVSKSGRARGKGKNDEDDGNGAAVAAAGGGARATRKGKPAARSSKQTKRKVARASSARLKKKKGLQGTKTRKEKWLQCLDRLKKYQDEKGSLKRVRFDDKPLAEWITIQRRQYCYRQKGEKSTMTDERVAALESVGFDWNPWETVWEERLEALKQFKATHGHCNVPQRGSEYKQLGNWVNTQRVEYRRKQNGEKFFLTDEHIAALESMGFDFNPRKFRKSDWETYLEDLKQFRANHGHCNVPKDWSENEQLAAWVIHQRAQLTPQLRQQRGRIIQGRIAALESLGFEWEPRAPSARVPQTTSDIARAPGFPSRNSRRMPTATIAQEAATWEARLEDLKQYKAQHGHCSVRWIENKQLAYWVARQRQQYQLHKQGGETLMTNERIAAFESLGFDLNPAASWTASRSMRSPIPKATARQVKSTAKWEKRLQELKQYKAEHGHCRVLKGWIENKQLASWVARQRYEYSLKQRGEKAKITDDRIAALESLGFDWKFSGDWEKRLDELRQYKAKHGHCNVPMRWDGNKPLAHWVAKQRAQYQRKKRGKKAPITNERIAALENLGFDFNPKKIPTAGQVSWEERLEELRQYKANHGHCKVPQAWIGNKPLAYWVTRQRVQYQLRKKGESSSMTDERVSALESIGFEWFYGSPPTDWSTRFEELREYIDRHGDCNVPFNWSENKRLASWIWHQRRAYQSRKRGEKSTMTDERVTALESIGFEWVGRKDRGQFGSRSRD